MAQVMDTDLGQLGPLADMALRLLQIDGVLALDFPGYDIWVPVALWYGVDDCLRLGRQRDAPGAGLRVG